MKHIFIVGGSGMLRYVTEYYIESGYIVTLMARKLNKLQKIKAKYPAVADRIFLIPQDYREADEAIRKTQNTVRIIGRIDLALLWIHGSGQSFSEQLISYIFANNKQSIIYRLLGSSSSDPLKLADTHLLQKYPTRYREIYLGYKKKNEKVRWLHDQEISKGVMEAMNSDEQTYVVGEIHPWEKRPN